MPRLRFDRYELDPDQGLLLRDGARVKLPPQPLTVLAFLVRSPGRVVSREELKRAVWSDGTHVEFEGSLHSCIKQLRAALEDDAAAPRFIETLPKRGYRFLPGVHPANARSQRRALLPALLVGSGLLFAALAFRLQTTHPMTLLVQPFQNETGLEDLDYLGPALADEARERLSALDPTRLVVLARGTAARYRAASGPPVDYRLEGRVVLREGTPALEADLVRASDQARLWSDRIGEGDRVSRMIASLVPHLVDAPLGETSPAREAYWKGRYASRGRDRESLARAERFFRQALALGMRDEAAPHAGLAEVRLRRALASGDRDDYDRAARSARRALELEPSAEVRFVLALAEWFGERDWERAGASFQRTLLQAPGMARAHHWYGYFLTGLGRHEEAIVEVERARNLDPLSPEVLSDVGWFYYFAGRPREAIEASRHTLELEPRFLLAQDCLLESYLALGEGEAALRAADRYREIAEADRERPRRTDLETFWRYRLDRAMRDSARPNAYEASIAALRLGREDEALLWLRRALESRSLWMAVVAVDPRLDPIRHRPELADIEAALGFP